MYGVNAFCTKAWPTIVLRTDAAFRMRADANTSAGAAVLEVLEPLGSTNRRTPLALWAETFDTGVGGVSDAFVAETRAVALGLEFMVGFLLDFTQLLFDVEPG